MSTTPQTEAEPMSDQGDVEALRERVAELEESREADLLRVRNSVQDDIQQYRDNVVKPKFAELEDKIETLEKELEEQRTELENITGPGDGNPTKPEQRTRAVRQMMINQAEARDHGTLGWGYNDVIDNLESNGHGRVYAQQAYRIMEAAGEAAGFAHTKNDDGEHSLRVSLSALPAEKAVNNVNNGEGVAEGEQSTNTAAVASND